ncbi:MAG: septum formation initiator family protein [Acidimicrobiia bacterium]
MTSRNRAARLGIFVLVLVALLFAFGYPARSLLAQRATENEAREHLEILRDQNAKLEAEAERLRSDEEIERQARERFHLVRPGEEAYAIIPQGSTSTTAPPEQLVPSAPAIDGDVPMGAASPSG